MRDSLGLTFQKKDLPTIPIFKLLLGRPSNTFFSGGAAFFGGIRFFMKIEGVVLKKTERGRWFVRTGKLQPATKLTNIKSIIWRPIDVGDRWQREQASA